jgi:hypothetical protein
LLKKGVVKVIKALLAIFGENPWELAHKLIVMRAHFRYISFLSWRGSSFGLKFP